MSDLYLVDSVLHATRGQQIQFLGSLILSLFLVHFICTRIAAGNKHRARQRAEDGKRGSSDLDQELQRLRMMGIGLVLRKAQIC